MSKSATAHPPTTPPSKPLRVPSHHTTSRVPPRPSDHPSLPNKVVRARSASPARPTPFTFTSSSSPLHHHLTAFRLREREPPPPSSTAHKPSLFLYEQKRERSRTLRLPGENGRRTGKFPHRRECSSMTVRRRWPLLLLLLPTRHQAYKHTRALATRIMHFYRPATAVPKYRCRIRCHCNPATATAAWSPSILVLFIVIIYTFVHAQVIYLFFIFFVYVQ